MEKKRCESTYQTGGVEATLHSPMSTPIERLLNETDKTSKHLHKLCDMVKKCEPNILAATRQLLQNFQRMDNLKNSCSISVSENIIGLLDQDVSPVLLQNGSKIMPGQKNLRGNIEDVIRRIDETISHLNQANGRIAVSEDSSSSKRLLHQNQTIKTTLLPAKRIGANTQLPSVSATKDAVNGIGTETSKVSAQKPSKKRRREDKSLPAPEDCDLQKEDQVPHCSQEIDETENRNTKAATDTFKAESVTIRVKIVKAIYDFEQQASGEMSMKKGDSFNLIEKQDDGWSSVQSKDGKTGLVPTSYIEVLEV